MPKSRRLLLVLGLSVLVTLCVIIAVSLSIGKTSTMDVWSKLRHILTRQISNCVYVHALTDITGYFVLNDDEVLYFSMYFNVTSIRVHEENALRLISHTPQDLINISYVVNGRVVERYERSPLVVSYLAIYRNGTVLYGLAPPPSESFHKFALLLHVPLTSRYREMLSSLFNENMLQRLYINAADITIELLRYIFDENVRTYSTEGHNECYLAENNINVIKSTRR